MNTQSVTLSPLILIKTKTFEVSVGLWFFSTRLFHCIPHGSEKISQMLYCLKRLWFFQRCVLFERNCRKNPPFYEGCCNSPAVWDHVTKQYLFCFLVQHLAHLPDMRCFCVLCKDFYTVKGQCPLQQILAGGYIIYHCIR